MKSIFKIYPVNTESGEDPLIKMHSNYQTMKRPMCVCVNPHWEWISILGLAMNLWQADEIQK